MKALVFKNSEGLPPVTYIQLDSFFIGFAAYLVMQGFTKEVYFLNKQHTLYHYMYNMYINIHV